MNRILLIILLLFYLMLIKIEAAFALSHKEERDLLKYVNETCKEYHKPCRASIIKDTNKVQAMTSPAGEILFTKPLLNKLTYDEAVAVGLHEVGHHILNHFTNGKSSYTNEFEADKFATFVLLYSNKSNTLPSALKKIVPAKYWNYATTTHPPSSIRVEFMNKYQDVYERRKNDYRKKV